jgi:hypothetical protein
MLTRRTALVGSLTLVAADDAAAAAPQKVAPEEATVTFPEAITAMCEVQVGRLAVATGNRLYIIKVR